VPCIADCTNQLSNEHEALQQAQDNVKAQIELCSTIVIVDMVSEESCLMMDAVDNVSSLGITVDTKVC
jgi:hypothetical protein